MPWLRTIFTSLVAAIAGALFSPVVAVAVVRFGDLNSDLLLLSHRVLFSYIPLGALAGAIIGFGCVAVSRRRSWWKSIALALCLTGSGLIAAGTIVYFVADKPPKLGGKPLILEFEVRVPDTIRLPEPLTDRGFYPWIFETQNAKWWTHVELEEMVRSGSDTIIPCYARLRSSRATARFIEVAYGDAGERWQKIALPLRGRPTVQERWSDWIPAQSDSRGNALPSAEKMALRYRVQVADARRLSDAW